MGFGLYEFRSKSHNHTDNKSSKMPAECAGLGHVYVGDDQEELEAVGYKQEMPRQFSVFGLMSLSFALTCTWNGTGSSIGTALTEGSTSGAIWSLPIAGFLTFITSAGMAELASAFPVAGAQYYWSFMVASERHRAFFAYLNGWLSVLGWWLTSASVLNFAASMVLSCANLWYPDYVIQRYQQWLVYVLLTWMVAVVNIFGANVIPYVHKLTFIVAVLSLGSTIITLLVCSRNRYPSASWVFGDFQNSTGWESDGLSYVLAIANAVYAFLGTDCGAHMCEEIKNPGKNVPRVILWPIFMGLITAWPFCVACMAAITDVNAVINTSTGLPLLEIYYQGTQSKVGATILMALFAYCFFGCAMANGTTSSRTLWAISRDGALPYSPIWCKVNMKYKMPINALLLSCTVVSLYGLIFLGSTTAFTSMVGAAIVFLQTSCVVPQAIVLWRGRDKTLPPRYFDLGRFGPFVNGIAILWVAFLDIIYCLPSLMPVTKNNMNYVSVVSVGLVSFVIGLWFCTKRGVFKGPKIDLEEVKRRREEGLGVTVVEGMRPGSSTSGELEKSVNTSTKEIKS